MTYKTFYKALLGTAALTALSTGSAFAAGTAAGTNVQNTFTLNYEVDSVPQTEINNTGAPTEFTVDRVIDLTVASQGNATVQPGETNQELVYTLTNEGNDTQDFALTVADVAGGDFSPIDPATNGLTLQVSLNGGARTDYNAANPPTLDADDVLTVYVVRDIPAGAADTDQAEISLLAQTLNANTTTPAAEDTDGNTVIGVAENVFADADGVFDPNGVDGDDNDADGYHSDSGSYVVASADVTAAKTVTVFSQDGTDCANFAATAPTGEQYSIPGACVEYRISATNAGALAATAVAINDQLPIYLTYVDSQVNVFTGGTLTEPTLGDDCGPTLGNCTVNLSGATLGTGDTGVVIIRALVK